MSNHCALFQGKVITLPTLNFLYEIASGLFHKTLRYYSTKKFHANKLPRFGSQWHSFVITKMLQLANRFLAQRRHCSDCRFDELEMFAGFGVDVCARVVRFTVRNPAPVPWNVGREGEGDDGDAGRQSWEEQEQNLNLKNWIFAFTFASNGLLLSSYTSSHGCYIDWA